MRSLPYSVHGFSWKFLLPLYLLLAVILVPFILWRCALRKRRLQAGYPKAMLIISQSPGNHSPRAYAHGTAAVKSGLVETVLYVTECPGPSQNDPNIKFIPIMKLFSTSQDGGRSKGGSVGKLQKLISLGYHLYYALISASRLRFHVTHVVLNTPPILPTLPIVALIRIFLFPDAKFILDVHNLAFSLMRFTSSSLVVHVATVLELIFIRMTMLFGSCWTVSFALADYLRRQVGVRNVIAVHDRPRASFFTAAQSEHMSIIEIISHEATKFYASETHALTTRLARVADSYSGKRGDMEEVESIPIVVSSSSWTPDEDFSLLLQALRRLDREITSPILFVLTGKGPGRQVFEEQIIELRLRSIAVAFTWLPIFDYPRILARANVGVCLHTSSSGLDLPMKAVDLLAAQTPVIALRYFCIEELIRPGETGLLFDDAIELCATIKRIVFPETVAELDAVEKLRIGVREQIARGFDWDTCWQRTALTTLRQ